MESLLARSFPCEGDADRIRKIFAESLEHDALGMAAVRANGKICFSFPTLILVSTISE